MNSDALKAETRSALDCFASDANARASSVFGRTGRSEMDPLLKYYPSASTAAICSSLIPVVTGFFVLIPSSC